MSLSKKTTPTLKPKTSVQIFGLVILGLMVDQWLQPYGQWLVNAIVWIFFIHLIQTSEKSDRKRWWICLALATAGELILCEVYGLYTYRENNIPLFVPPGHVLLYASGLWLSSYISHKWAWGVLAVALPYAVYCFTERIDQISLVLFGLWCLMLYKKELRPLITTMFVLALLMELLGTSLENWTWAPHVAFMQFELAQSNPPFAVGVLYCGLDFLVNMIFRNQMVRAAMAAS